MPSNIKHSLLVPCYNAVAYIDRFIIQLSKLNIAFDEILFYDDASDDNTINEIEKRGYFIIKGSQNRGPGYARNQLAIAANGQYIHFHDIDDEIDPNFLELINEKIAISESDVILGYADWIDEKTRKTIIKWTYDELEIQKDSLSYFISHPLGIINTVYKKSAFLSIDGFNETIKCWEDADLHIRLAANKASFQVIKQVIAWSLRHTNGISENQTHCWSCRLKFLENYFKDYSKQLNNGVLSNELKKIQTVFINMGNFTQLKQVFMIDKQYNLGIKKEKALIIYFANKILPTNWLKKMVSYLKQK